MQDAEKYIKALDCAIIEYHSEKMREINAILRELWTEVYVRANGVVNDIEYIEIKTEAHAADAAKTAITTTSGRSKSYNYRVVMNIDGRDVDMRGRCSAGQKVLASILVRIALAEVFGVDLGMLALDEPTTNLDVDKIDALAVSLGALVEKRATQSNFMLLLITHDERFVELLQQATHTAAQVYRVQRNEVTQMSEIVSVAKA